MGCTRIHRFSPFLRLTPCSAFIFFFLFGGLTQGEGGTCSRAWVRGHGVLACVSLCGGGEVPEHPSRANTPFAPLICVLCPMMPIPDFVVGRLKHEINNVGIHTISGCHPGSPGQASPLPPSFTS
eukprot:RCo031423